MAAVRSATVYEPSSSAAGVSTHLSGLAQVHRLNYVIHTLIGGKTRKLLNAHTEDNTHLLYIHT